MTFIDWGSILWIKRGRTSSISFWSSIRYERHRHTIDLQLKAWEQEGIVIGRLPKPPNTKATKRIDPSGNISTMSSTNERQQHHRVWSKESWNLLCWIMVIGFSMLVQKKLFAGVPRYRDGNSHARVCLVERGKVEIGKRNGRKRGGWE